MKRSIKVYAYKLSDEWYFSKNKSDDYFVRPGKAKITFLPTTPSDTKRWLRHTLRSGLTVQPISTDDINQ